MRWELDILLYRSFRYASKAQTPRQQSWNSSNLPGCHPSCDVVAARAECTPPAHHSCVFYGQKHFNNQTFQLITDKENAFSYQAKLTSFVSLQLQGLAQKTWRRGCHRLQKTFRHWSWLSRPGWLTSCCWWPPWKRNDNSSVSELCDHVFLYSLSSKRMNVEIKSEKEQFLWHRANEMSLQYNRKMLQTEFQWLSLWTQLMSRTSMIFAAMKSDSLHNNTERDVLIPGAQDGCPGLIPKMRQRFYSCLYVTSLSRTTIAVWFNFIFNCSA